MTTPSASASQSASRKSAQARSSTSCCAQGTSTCWRPTQAAVGWLGRSRRQPLGEDVGAGGRPEALVAGRVHPGAVDAAGALVDVRAQHRGGAVAIPAGAQLGQRRRLARHQLEHRLRRGVDPRQVEVADDLRPGRRALGHRVRGALDVRLDAVAAGEHPHELGVRGALDERAARGRAGRRRRRHVHREAVALVDGLHDVGVGGVGPGAGALLEVHQARGVEPEELERGVGDALLAEARLHGGDVALEHEGPIRRRRRAQRADADLDADLVEQREAPVGEQVPVSLFGRHVEREAERRRLVGALVDLQLEDAAHRVLVRLAVDPQRQPGVVLGSHGLVSPAPGDDEHPPDLEQRVGVERRVGVDDAQELERVAEVAPGDGIEPIARALTWWWSTAAGTGAKPRHVELHAARRRCRRCADR